MLIEVDRQGDVPIVVQLVDGLRAAIARHEVLPGQRLPAARDLAWSLGVNTHTVLAAYKRLKEAHVVEIRRYRGTTVREDYSSQHDRLVVEFRGAVGRMRDFGIDKNQIIKLVEESV